MDYSKHTKSNVLKAVTGAKRNFEVYAKKQFGQNWIQKTLTSKTSHYNKKTLRAYLIYNQLFARYSLLTL